MGEMNDSRIMTKFLDRRTSVRIVNEKVVLRSTNEPKNRNKTERTLNTYEGSVLISNHQV